MIKPQFFHIIIICSVLFLILYICYKPTPKIPEDFMDSPKTKDPSLSDKSYLISTRFSEVERKAYLSKPVFIAVHGFTASTSEWKLFKDYVETHSDNMVSLVLLGGHGRDYETFKKSTWEDWGKPILNEFNALIKQGYKHINIISSSTGGTLVLNYLAHGYFTNETQLKHIFLIDTLIQPQDKRLFLTPYLKYFLKDKIKKHLTEITKEDKQYYQIQTHNALSELAKLLNHLRSTLEDKIEIPSHLSIDIYQSNGDNIVNPISGEIIYNHLKSNNKKSVTLNIVDSDQHVFTREKNKLQKKVFDNIIDKSKK